MAKRRSMSDAVGDEARSHKGIFDSPYLGGTDAENFIQEEGTYRLDIIPFEITTEDHPMVRVGKRDVGDWWWQRTFFIHRDVGPGGDETVICPKETFGRRCPFCEEMRRLFATKEPEDKEIAKKLMPKERELIRVINLDKDPDAILLWDVSYHLFGKQLRKEVKRGGAKHSCFADLEGGLTIVTSFETTSSPEGSYTKADRIDFEGRDGATYDEAVLEEGPNLNELISCPTFESLEALMLGQAPTKEADGELESEQEQPAPKAGKKVSRRKPKEDEPPAEDDAYQVGAEVVVVEDGTTYPGKITAVDGDEITIDFGEDIGEETHNRAVVTLQPEKPKPSKKGAGKKKAPEPKAPEEPFAPGTAVTVTDDGTDYTGKVISVVADVINIDFDGNEEGWDRGDVRLADETAPSDEEKAGNGESEGEDNNEWGDWD